MNTFIPNSPEYHFDEKLITSHKYSVRLARNWTEIESALKLRYQVFNLELNEGLEESNLTKMDQDEFDSQCSHLLVIENTTNQVIGTYRVQNFEQVSLGKGFYSQSEFNLNKFPNLILENGIELGRACIEKNHRNGRVLFLLWKGLAKLLINQNKRYLFGCCSQTSQDVKVAKIAELYLKEFNFMHSEFHIPVQEEFQCSEEKIFISQQDIKEFKLPTLFNLYLNLGCKVCSSAAIDKKFKTIDFLIILDKEALSDQSKSLFL